MKNILLTLLISIISGVVAGIAYRAGGSGRYPRAVRVIGIPILTASLAFMLGVHVWWALLISAGLGIAAISTYLDPIFKYDNHGAHGFLIGLSSFPIAIVTGHWWLFAARCLILAVFMGVWSRIWDWDVAEELGRGAVIPSTIFMIC